MIQLIGQKGLGEMLRYTFWTGLIGLIIIAVIFMTGPREVMDRTITFVAAEMGDDLDVYLAKREAAIPGIRPGAEAEIIWADPTARSKTELSFVYLHGFSASKEEIRPVPDRVAAAFGANLFYARLRGHGRDGEALASATAGQWWNDTVEALEIGRRLGERVIVIGASTGATLATLALADPEVSRNIVGFVAVSPNYEFHGAPLAVLTMPYAREILPPIMGERREWEPVSEDQGLWWTTSYPSVAVLPMAATVSAAKGLDFGRISRPALMIFDDDDQVVNHVITRQVAVQWGADVSILSPASNAVEAPSRHIIVGDIMGPRLTEPVTTAIVEWVKALN